MLSCPYYIISEPRCPLDSSLFSENLSRATGKTVLHCRYRHVGSSLCFSVLFLVTLKMLCIVSPSHLAFSPLLTSRLSPQQLLIGARATGSELPARELVLSLNCGCPSIFFHPFINLHPVFPPLSLPEPLLPRWTPRPYRWIGVCYCVSVYWSYCHFCGHSRKMCILCPSTKLTFPFVFIQNKNTVKPVHSKAFSIYYVSVCVFMSACVQTYWTLISTFTYPTSDTQPRSQYM
jgi:hypothetical protein